MEYNTSNDAAKKVTPVNEKYRIRNGIAVLKIKFFIIHLFGLLIKTKSI